MKLLITEEDVGFEIDLFAIYQAISAKAIAVNETFHDDLAKTAIKPKKRGPKKGWKKKLKTTDTALAVNGNGQITQ